MCTIYVFYTYTFFVLECTHESCMILSSSHDSHSHFTAAAAACACLQAQPKDDYHQMAQILWLAPTMSAFHGLCTAVPHLAKHARGKELFGVRMLTSTCAILQSRKSHTLMFLPSGLSKLMLPKRSLHFAMEYQFFLTF